MRIKKFSLLLATMSLVATMTGCGAANMNEEVKVTSNPTIAPAAATTQEVSITDEPKVEATATLVVEKVEPTATPEVTEEVIEVIATPVVEEVIEVTTTPVVEVEATATPVPTMTPVVEEVMTIPTPAAPVVPTPVVEEVVPTPVVEEVKATTTPAPTATAAPTSTPKATATAVATKKPVATATPKPVAKATATPKSTQEKIKWDFTGEISFTDEDTTDIWGFNIPGTVYAFREGYDVPCSMKRRADGSWEATIHGDISYQVKFKCEDKRYNEEDYGLYAECIGMYNVHVNDSVYTTSFGVSDGESREFGDRLKDNKHVEKFTYTVYLVDKNKFYETDYQLPSMERAKLASVGEKVTLYVNATMGVMQNWERDFAEMYWEIKSMNYRTDLEIAKHAWDSLGRYCFHGYGTEYELAYESGKMPYQIMNCLDSAIFYRRLLNLFGIEAWTGSSATHAWTHVIVGGVEYICDTSVCAPGDYDCFMRGKEDIVRERGSKTLRASWLKDTNVSETSHPFIEAWKTTRYLWSDTPDDFGDYECLGPNEDWFEEFLATYNE